MKYLRKFNTEAEVMMFDSPNVVLVADTKKTLYNVLPPNGVYIQHIDGDLYNSTEWSNKGFINDEANGVAVIHNGVSFVIAKNPLSERKMWATATYTLVEGPTTVETLVDAKADYDGKRNTQLMLAMDTSEAAFCCANYTFPNGAKGYLPSLGEMNLAYSYRTAIATALSKIGGKILSDSDHWTSTQANSSKAWSFYWSSSSSAMQTSKNSYRNLRPFAAL